MKSFSNNKIKTIGIYLILIFDGFGFLQSCNSNKQEDLITIDSCDTTNITFTASVFPILQDNCLGCHGNNNFMTNGHGIALENYQDVKSMAEAKYLYEALNWEYGYAKMPKGSAKLDDCSLKIIKLWIEQNYPQ